MSGFSYADPVDFDMTATTGSTTFAATNPSPGPWAYYAAANTSAAYFPASAALDNNIDTCWETNTLDPGNTWYAITAGAGGSTTCTTYTMRPRRYYAGRMPSAWTFEGSNDGSSWTVLDSQSGITDWDGSNGDPKTYTLSTPATYTYFRVNITAIQSDSIVNLAELHLNDTPNLTQPAFVYYYVRVRGCPNNRVYNPVFTAGTTNIVDEYSAWLAWVEAYPENTGDTCGSYNRNVPSASNMRTFGTFHGGGIILRFKLAGYGTFDWSWTSTDYPDRPQMWFAAQAITPVDGGTIAYDAVNYGTPLQNARYYTITPTTDAVITLTQDEPWSYMEVYRETGATSFDEYIEDGYNDADGNIYPNGGDCAFTPIPGETYVIVVYPNASPAPESIYHLTWATTVLTPPPYVVTNDSYLTPITIPIGTATSGAITYDNTGATEDDTGIHSGKRSIWYSLTVPGDQYISFTATPGTTDTGSMPSFYLMKGDGTSITVDLHQGYGMGPGRYAFKAQAGVTYLLQLYFDSSVPTTPWDDAGSLAWAIVDVSNDTSSTARTLSVGADQNIVASHPITGYAGNAQWFTVTVPIDGGFNVVLEKPDGTTGSTNAQLYIPVPVTSSTPTGLVYQGDVPVRVSGTTVTSAMIRDASAGQVYVLRVVATIPNTALRWGVSTDVTWGGWHSTDWGKHISNADTENVNVWGVFINYQVGASGSVSWYANDTISTADTGSASAEAVGDLIGPVSSGSNCDGPHEGGTAQPYIRWGGYTVRNLGFGTKTTFLEFSNVVYGQKVGLKGNSTVDPSVVTDTRLNPYSDDNLAPVLNAANTGFIEQYALAHPESGWTVPSPRLERNEIGTWAPDYVGPSGFGAWLTQNKGSFAVEWSADNATNAPRFDIFRAAQAGWHSQVSGSGTFATSYQPDEGMQSELVVRVNDIPAVGGSNPPYFLGPYVGGVVVDSFNQGADGSYGGSYLPHGDVYNNNILGLMDDCRILADVTNHQWPENDWSHTEVYGCQTFLPGEINYTEMWERLGSAEGPGGWPFFSYEVSWRVALQIGRKYPDQYRVGKYTEDLGTLAPPVELPGPGAGYYILPTPNLDGEPGGVEVHFASAT